MWRIKILNHESWILTSLTTVLTNALNCGGVKRLLSFHEKPSLFLQQCFVLVLGLTSRVWIAVKYIYWCVFILILCCYWFILSFMLPMMWIRLFWKKSVPKMPESESNCIPNCSLSPSLSSSPNTPTVSCDIYSAKKCLKGIGHPKMKILSSLTFTFTH